MSSKPAAAPSKAPSSYTALLANASTSSIGPKKLSVNVQERYAMAELRSRTAAESWGNDLFFSAMLDNNLLSDLITLLERCQTKAWTPTEAEARLREFCDSLPTLKGRQIGAMLALHEFDSLESPEAFVARLGGSAERWRVEAQCAKAGMPHLNAALQRGQQQDDSAVDLEGDGPSLSVLGRSTRLLRLLLGSDRWVEAGDVSNVCIGEFLAQVKRWSKDDAQLQTKGLVVTERMLGVQRLGMMYRDASFVNANIINAGLVCFGRHAGVAAGCIDSLNSPEKIPNGVVRWSPVFHCKALLLYHCKWEVCSRVPEVNAALQATTVAGILLLVEEVTGGCALSFPQALRFWRDGVDNVVDDVKIGQFLEDAGVYGGEGFRQIVAKVESWAAPFFALTRDGFGVRGGVYNPEATSTPTTKTSRSSYGCNGTAPATASAAPPLSAPQPLPPAPSAPKPKKVVAPVDWSSIVAKRKKAVEDVVAAGRRVARDSKEDWSEAACERDYEILMKVTGRWKKDG